jgi:catechol 2,3-dioxygenase-like lactoylglutathione lyase family enzyme
VISGLNHTSFTVSSLERSIGFYRDLLGLELEATWERHAPWIGEMTGFKGARLRLAALRVPGTEHVLELIEYEKPRGERLRRATNDVGSAHIGFVVDDLDAEYGRLRAAGVEFLSAPVRVTDPPAVGARAVYFRDPDGIPLELQERKV